MGGLLCGVLLAALVTDALPGVAAGDEVAKRMPDSSQERFPEPPPGAAVRSPPFPVNKNGMTYGSGIDVDADNAGPELMAAYGTNGAFGYIRASDRDSGAASLEEALAGPRGGYTIPLYAQDGVTVIGEFDIE